MRKIDVMISVRNSTFETNSSSTHSICIPKKCDYRNMSYIPFRFGEFGWNTEDVCAADYLYTALMNYYEDEEREIKLQKLKDILDKNNIKYSFQPIKYKQYFRSKETYEDIGCIDHCSELCDFLETILEDEDMLLRYLWDGRVYTGNDNTWFGAGEQLFANQYLAYYRPEPDVYDYFYKSN